MEPPTQQASVAPPAKASKKRKKGKSTPPAPGVAEGVPSVEQRLAKQVEYYFSNANLRRDGHLKKLLGPDAALQGWASLDHVASFSRAKDIVDEALVTQKDAGAEARLDVVRKALRSYSKDVELSEDATQVRRTKPFEDENDASVGARTVYVEPVGAEETHATLGLRFAACGKVVHVSLPKSAAEGDESLRGFAFVEFEAVDGAAAACEALDGSPLAGGGVLRVITRLEWAAVRRRWNTLMYNPVTTRRSDEPREKPEAGPQAEQTHALLQKPPALDGK
ncbi:hypothetical protein M885DRAFT_612887 [Pelagophyceae sp. CCMP2097]|nr:hypothetical protein M885DRAFT_612887 [Pelagophyceae sp. CCMP2097]